METMTLERDALPPVRFPGERLAQVSGRMVGGTEQNRWYELALYQHENRRYVLAWRYRTLWHGETRHARVETGVRSTKPCARLRSSIRSPGSTATSLSSLTTPSPGRRAMRAALWSARPGWRNSLGSSMLRW